jgi:hypothetical protein
MAVPQGVADLPDDESEKVVKGLPAVAAGKTGGTPK